MFINKSDNKIANDYIDKGYVITKIEELTSLDYIDNFFKSTIEDLSNTKLDKKNLINDLNHFHQTIDTNDLNNIRLKIINNLNSDNDFKFHYYNLSKKYLDIIVGNELAMQQKINLSIQLPKDNSSLLPLHADVWSGDSPFEVVVWFPLVDCYKTKSMYLLPPSKMKKLDDNFSNLGSKSSDDLFNLIKDDLIWLDIKKGEIFLFNQALPHGNIVNDEDETRWSMNCRFKNIFTPYGDKKLGEFFRPISLKPASKIGLNYKFPKLG